ncbi:hypothetical protein PROFUN_04362 [Planoprotostelium fungivorum]|uniref:Feruloyl esterase n=1 Tax=Planoprotostelium fungivorum TaxID=1890364 RepID=A0A2P6NHQ3_9EUKA|nr:hypothetical protein PROFUN_04362 [Planoprotostelium fungivorum]
MRRIFQLLFWFTLAHAWGKQVDIDRPEGKRSYWLYEPKDYQPTKSYPLQVWLHGLTGSHYNAFLFSVTTGAYDSGYLLAVGEGTTSNSSFVEKSVFPLTKLGWNAGECCGVFVDDVGYVKQMVSDVKSKWNVDRSRVFLSGFSNGAMLTERIACETGDTIFSAYASCAGSVMVSPGGNEGLKTCDASFGTSTVSYVHFHGLNDTTVPWGGYEPSKIPSALDNYRGWVQRLGCTEERQTDPSDGVSVKRGDRSAELVRVNDAGHLWWEPNLPKFLFGKFPGVDVTRYVLTFFGNTPNNMNAL